MENEIREEETAHEHTCDRKFSHLVVKKNGYDMKRVCDECGKVIEDPAPISTFEGFVRAFVHGKLGRKTRLGNYRLSKDKTRLEYEGSGRNTEHGIDVLALKLQDGRIIGNASILPRCGSYRRGTEAPAQRVMFDMNMAMIPFSVFDEVGLDIQTATIIEQGPEEDLLMPKLRWDNSTAMMEPVDIYDRGESWKKPKSDKHKKIVSCELDEVYCRKRAKNGRLIKNKEGEHIYGHFPRYVYRFIDKTKIAKRHFVGAMLIEVGGKQFLFDLDRNEVKHYRFNPFLTELPVKSKTIAKAYETLKPKEVVAAEKKGIEVIRQGEWFFIKSKNQNPEDDVPRIDPKYTKKQEQLTEKARLVRFDLAEEYLPSGYAYDRDVLDLKTLKDNLKYYKVKPKYRGSILERATEYNKVATRLEKISSFIDNFNKVNKVYRWGGELKAGDNRPNTAKKMVRVGDITYVSGRIEHTGREHEPVNLEGWYEAVPNTAVASFTISGNID